MVQISTQAYHKTYLFPFFSMTTLVRAAFLVATIALPFFLAYSSPNFYLPSQLQVSEAIPLSYMSQYHITITTTSLTYVYTNLFTQVPTRAISIQQSDSEGSVMFGFEWPKEITTERVLNVKILLFFSYPWLGTSGVYGIAHSEISGSDLSEGSIMGVATFQKGNGNTPILTASQIFAGKSYDLPSTLLSLYQSSSYMDFKYTTLPINMPNDVLQIRVGINYSSFLANKVTPSIIGQLIWSWIQYFPLFLAFYWAANHIVEFLLRENILSSNLVHDKEYLKIVQEENLRQAKSGIQ